MARKTNCERNGIKYFRKYATLGGQRKMIYAESEKAWNQKVEELKRLDNFGIVQTKDTLGQAMDMWVYTLMVGRHDIRKTTVSIYETVYRNKIKDHPIMRLPLGEVKTIHIQTFINEMVNQGSSYHAINQGKKVLNMFFKYAVSEGYVLRNPCANTSMPKYEPPGDIEIFSDEEIKLIIGNIRGSHYWFMYLLAFATGMRMGELMALTYEDFKDGKVTVNKSLIVSRRPQKGADGVKIECPIEIGPPKTDSSYRDIPVSENILKELDEWKKEAQLKNLKLGKGKLKDTDLVFTSPTGMYCRNPQIANDWKWILESLGIPHKKFHATRHTYITKLVQANMNLVTIMQLAGHSSLKTTLRYTHIEAEEKKVSADIMDKILL